MSFSIHVDLQTLVKQGRRQALSFIKKGQNIRSGNAFFCTGWHHITHTLENPFLLLFSTTVVKSELILKQKEKENTKQKEQK